MTAGYDGPELDDESGPRTERPGPLPPRMNTTGSLPAVPASPPAFSHAPAPGTLPPPPAAYTGAPPGSPAHIPAHAARTGAFPAPPPVSGAFPAQPVSGAYPAQPVSGQFGPFT